MYNVEMVYTPRNRHESNRVRDRLPRGTAGSIEGPRLVCDPMGVDSCVLRVP